MQSIGQGSMCIVHKGETVGTRFQLVCNSWKLNARTQWIVSHALLPRRSNRALGRADGLAQILRHTGSQKQTLGALWVNSCPARDRSVATALKSQWRPFAGSRGVG